MKRLLLPIVLALSGCTINAVAPIQANTQVDQRQGTFAGGSGPTQAIGGVSGSQQTASGGIVTAPAASNGSISPVSSGRGFENVRFAGVKTFSPQSLAVVLNFETVVVADGTTLHITRDKGASWTQHENVGSQTITSMYWLDDKTGWVGGDKGAILKLSVDASGKVTYELQDSLTDRAIQDIYFKDANTGFLVNSGGGVCRTSNGGVTWADKVAPYADTEASRLGLREGHDVSSFIPGPDGWPWYKVQAGDYSSGALFRYQEGIFVPQVAQDVGAFTSVAFGGSRAFLFTLINSNRPYYQDGMLYSTEDYATFKVYGPDVRSKSQIRRDIRLRRAYPINQVSVIGFFHDPLRQENKTWAISRDGGASWTDPTVLPIDYVRWIKPFSEDRIWAWGDGKLYRAGT